VKLAVNLGYWDSAHAGNLADSLRLAVEAERLGYSSAWTAEAYGSDAVSVLSYVAARTSRIGLGTGVLQIPARTPAMTAMTAATLDTLSGGRLLLGLGVSGPQVSEGWHGVRFARPLGRTREYVEIVRLALSRRRVRYDGEHFQLPLPDGPGKALQLTVRPVRDRIPIYLASIGPKNLQLTGEIADGWLGVLVATGHAGELLEHLAAGRARAGRTMDGFDVAAYVPLSVGEDVAACAAPVRPYTALYIGGMGSREHNFYNNLAARMGYGAQADVVQDRYLARDYDGAAAAVPADLIDQTSLLGPVGRIAERIAAFAEAGVTTIAVTPYGETIDDRVRAMETAVAALERSGVAAS
jgi:F420-dependent oxidoreductase-like protein